VKKYLKNLWLALLGKKIQSGLKPNTWYRIQEIKTESFPGVVLTDDFGHIVPFVQHWKTYTWSSGETKSDHGGKTIKFTEKESS